MKRKTFFWLNFIAHNTVILILLSACNSIPPKSVTLSAQATPAVSTTSTPGHSDIFTGIGTDVAVPLPVGDSTRGAALFAQRVRPDSGSALPCQGCHALQPYAIIVGPSLAGLATRAAAREPGKSAAEYIRESIQRPNAFIVPDSPYFSNNGQSIMPTHLGSLMSAQNLADLIAYLLTLN
jgi:cytochrome c2